MADSPRRWTLVSRLPRFVSFEPFCGDAKRAERPRSRVERRARISREEVRQLVARQPRTDGGGLSVHGDGGCE